MWLEAVLKHGASDPAQPSVNQDALIGNAASLSLEGAQGSAGVVEGLEHRHRLQISRRWKAGDGVAGMHHKRAGMLEKHGFS